MKSVATFGLLLLAATRAQADDPVPVESPVGQLRLAVEDLATRVPVADAPFTRYVSFASVPKSLRADFRRVWPFWLNHMSAARSLVRETVVPGSAGTLVRIDLRQAPNWTRVAWAVVADRDYLFREVPFGLLPHRETQFGRLVCGLEQSQQTFAAGFLVNAFQLFRDSLESDRSPTYYDLLYGAERHPDPDAGDVFVPVDPGPEPVKPPTRPWPGGIWPHDKTYYPAGAFEYIPKAEFETWEKAHAAWLTNRERGGQPRVAPRAGELIPVRPIGVKDAGKGIANFPAKGLDFERRWGAEVKAADLKTFLIDPRIGGIAAGADGDARNGSFVASNDRAIRIVPTVFGWSARTFDVSKNVGDRDHIERFREVALNQAKAEAGEILASLPNGAQAGLLVNGADERQEIAPTTFASIRSAKIDARYQDVRTMQGCIACHTPSGGFLAFTEQVRDSIERGIKANVLDAKEAQAVTDFYLSWERQIKGWRMPYLDFVADTTRGPDGKSLTGAQTWEIVRTGRDWYDLPVTLEVAAAEMGMAPADLRGQLVGKAEGDGPAEARLNQLAVGKGVPRRTWQEEVAGKLALFLAAKQSGHPPVVDPKVMEQGYAKFKVRSNP